MYSAFDQMKSTNAPQTPNMELTSIKEAAQAMEKAAMGIQEVTKAARVTVDSSAFALSGVNKLLDQAKTLVDQANALYAKMIGADKEGKRKLQWTLAKGILIGLPSGMSIWMIIWAIWLRSL